MNAPTSLLRSSVVRRGKLNRGQNCENQKLKIDKFSKSESLGAPKDWGTQTYEGRKAQIKAWHLNNLSSTLIQLCNEFNIRPIGISNHRQTWIEQGMLSEFKDENS